VSTPILSKIVAQRQNRKRTTCGAPISFFPPEKQMGFAPQNRTEANKKGRNAPDFGF